MIALALLLQAAVPLPAQPSVPLPAPPAEWSALPDLPVPAPHQGFDPSAYVRREVAASRCRAQGVDGGARWITSPVAVLVDAGGLVARVVPGAIGCPTVEQYTAGYVSTLARRAIAHGAAIRPGWYRHVVTYRWPG